MFCGFGIVFVLVEDWSSSLTSQGGSYGSVLVWGKGDVIPSIVRPDICCLCKEPI